MHDMGAQGVDEHMINVHYYYYQAYKTFNAGLDITEERVKLFGGSPL